MIENSLEIIKNAENWLKEPLLTSEKDSQLESENLIHSLQTIMLQKQSSKKVIGPLIGRIKSMQKTINSIERINKSFIYISGLVLNKIQRFSNFT